jgi:hypothetical protein
VPTSAMMPGKSACSGATNQQPAQSCRALAIECPAGSGTRWAPPQPCLLARPASRRSGELLLWRKRHHTWIHLQVVHMSSVAPHGSLNGLAPVITTIQRLSTAMLILALPGTTRAVRHVKQVKGRQPHPQAAAQPPNRACHALPHHLECAG